MDFKITASNMEQLILKIQELVATYGLKVIGAIFILVFGWFVARIIRTITRKLMVKGKVDETLISFLTNLIYYTLLAFVFVAALGQLGVQTASFIAIIGAAGLAIGLALQGALSNFAAGVLIILLRPFKVGDRIDGAGESGVVENVQMFTTQLVTANNKTIIIPNSKLSGDVITNYTSKGTLKVDMVFGAGYDDDLKKVKEIL